MAAELLESRRFVVEKGGKVVKLKAEKEVGTLAYLARRFVEDLKKAHQRQQDNVRSARSREDRVATLGKKEGALVASLARAPTAQRPAVEAELAAVRKDLD